MRTNVRKSFLLVITILMCGCAANPYLVHPKQQTISLDNNQGIVLVSLLIRNSSGYQLKLNSSFIQEINQYKYYKKLRAINIPKVAGDGSTDNCYLFAWVLPHGKYRYSHSLGYMTSFMGTRPLYLPANTAFDVTPGDIKYLGQLVIDVSSAFQSPSLMQVNDNYDDDVRMFKAHLPILSDREIKKDSFYVVPQ